MDSDQIRLWQRIVDAEDIREVVKSPMCVVKGELALLFETSCSVDTDWDILAAVFAFGECFNVFEVSNAPGSKLNSISNYYIMQTGSARRYS